ncbi:MAG: histidine phosphatase family protein, partial [Clostridia bacterium]|nr:histidine phosphatase family protein [Clostridia bacterium]
MTTFILVRHGESMANKTKSYAGQIDIPLSEEGFLQAEAVSRYIEENFKVDAVYSSDLSRAYNTIKPFADKCKLAIEKRMELREVNVGLWHRMCFDEVEKEYPDLIIKRKENPDLFRYPEGESYREVAKRGGG